MKIHRYLPFSKSEIATGLLCCLAVTVLVAGSRLSRLYNTNTVQSEKPVSIYLKNKVTLDQLSNILIDSALIRDGKELKWAGRLLGWRSFSPGHYRIEGSYSYDVLLSRMARGIQDPVRVTIPPGITRGGLFGRISEELRLDSADIVEAYNDSAFWAETGLDEADIMGRMYPNTYSFYWTADAQSVFKKIIRQFRNSVADSYRERISEIDKSLDEIVIMASIIEWEANRNEEKPVISGVYWNRLDKRMYLQADPTVNYALGERRRLLYDDYKMDHPYNTYVNLGLPPGPITNPSMSSIIAALYPSEHQYLYMVASPGGYHDFSETFEEHKRKSEKWRKWIREQYRIKRQQEQDKNEVNSQL